MARLFQAGFETGDTTQIGTDNASGVGYAVAVVGATPAPRSGAYCLKCGGTPGGNTWNNAIARKLVAHATRTELWYSLGLYVHHVGSTSAPIMVFFVAYDTVGSINVFLTVDGGVVRAYYPTTGGSSPLFANCTLIGTSGTSLSYDAWHLVEVRIVAATGATGALEVWQDGVQVINATAVRTAQTNANLASVGLVFTNVQNAGALSSGSYHAFDDVRVNDPATGSVNTGRPGDESIRLLVPNAAGDLAQLTRGGADSGSNFGQVDETPPSAADYVFSDTVGQADLYNLPSVAASAISAIDVIVQGFNSGGGGALNLVVKTGAGQSDGGAQALTATPTLYHRLLEADPADGAAWSQARLDALQVGVKVAS